MKSPNLYKKPATNAGPTHSIKSPTGLKSYEKRLERSAAAINNGKKAVPSAGTADYTLLEFLRFWMQLPNTEQYQIARLIALAIPDEGPIRNNTFQQSAEPAKLLGACARISQLIDLVICSSYTQVIKNGYYSAKLLFPHHSFKNRITICN